MDATENAHTPADMRGDWSVRAVTVMGADLGDLCAQQARARSADEQDQRALRSLQP
jgi:hypothetical protein